MGAVLWVSFVLHVPIHVTCRVGEEGGERRGMAHKSCLVSKD